MSCYRKVFSAFRAVLAGFFLGFSLLAQADVLLAPGLGHNLLLKPNGGLWVWGYNGSGQLGDGSNNERLQAFRLGTGYTSAAAGNNHSLAVRSDGTLLSWGSNYSGQLGIGSQALSASTPQTVGTGFGSVAVGALHSLALKQDGSLWAWGDNYFGQLGDAGQTQRNAPYQIGTGFKQIAAGGFHNLALKNDGSLWAWGLNDNGQLGTGDRNAQHEPIQIPGTFTAISAGANHSAALKADGSLWTWGGNDNGELGNGNNQAVLQPTQVGSDYAMVSCGSNFTLAVKTGGALMSWGANAAYQLGDGTDTAHNTPQPIGNGFTTVAAGRSHSLAVKADGKLYAWGDNALGQLGNGSKTPQSVPAAMGFFDASGGSDVTLNLSLTGTGTVQVGPTALSCSGSCALIFPSGSALSLSTTTDSIHSFAGWGGDCSGTGNCQLQLNGNRNVSATFQGITLTVHSRGKGSVFSNNLYIPNVGSFVCNSDCSIDTAVHAQVILGASPDPGYMLAGWSGDCTGTASCSLTMSGGREVTATFVQAAQLNLHITGSGQIIDRGDLLCFGECNRNYPLNSSVVLDATPAAGSRFIGWSGACSGGGNCRVTLDQVRDVTAHFAELPPVTLSSHFPLATGNYWQFVNQSNNAVTASVSVQSPVSLNGNQAFPLQHNDGSIVYFTNDANGLRIHGQYVPNGVQVGNSSYTYSVVFDPPMLLQPASAKFATVQSFSGNAQVSVPGLGNYLFSYSGSSNLLPPSLISTPKGNFMAVGLNYQYTIAGVAQGYYISVPVNATDWLSAGIGLVQESLAGTTLLLSQTNLSPQSPSQSLVSGWNLLGNGNETALDVATVFGDATQVQSVWKWVSSGSSAGLSYPTWAFYTPLQADGGKAYAAGKGYEALTSIAGGEGFWVNAKQAYTATLPGGTGVALGSFKAGGKRPLKKGWSLIATGDYPSPLSVNNSLGTPPNPGDPLPTNLTSLWTWEPGSGRWYFWSPLLYNNGSLTTYLDGKNYLDVSTLPSAPAGLLTPGTGFWVNLP